MRCLYCGKRLHWESTEEGDYDDQTIIKFSCRNKKCDTWVTVWHRSETKTGDEEE